MRIRRDKPLTPEQRARRNERARQAYYAARELRKEKVRRYRRENPDRARDWDQRRRYGITLDERNELLAMQGNRCACCGGPNPLKRDWCTDHDHKTGLVRGILCYRCNTALGMLDDDPALLRAAIVYLETTGRTVTPLRLAIIRTPEKASEGCDSAGAPKGQ